VIIGATNSVSSFTNFIYFRKMDIYLAKSLATGFCFLKAFIKSNSFFRA
jgi:hypothetical protein